MSDDWKASTRGGPPPARTPRFGFGVRLKSPRHPGFVWVIDAIYVDFHAARDAFVVPENWWAIQINPPSTKDQIFYSLISQDGRGAVLIGENDLEPAT